MRWILIALSCLAALSSTAQTQELLSGGWTTSNALKSTVIIAVPTAAARVYQIDCQGIVNDGETFQVQVIVDGTPLLFYLVEATTVVVEGKNIVLRQINTGAGKVRGTWRVIQRPEITSTRLLWAGYPPLNREILIAAFTSPQEFVLSINLTSPGCSGGSIIVYIDGNPVKDAAGNVVLFSEGSSVYGVGKSVNIRVAGTCGTFNTVNGELKIIKSP